MGFPEPRREPWWRRFRWAPGPLASFVVAACALGLSLYQARETNQEKRLAALPRIRVSFYFNDDGAGWRSLNVGLGPADTRWFEVRLDGEPKRRWRDVADALGVPPKATYLFTAPAPGAFMRPTNESMVLWWAKPHTSPVAAAMREHWRRVTIRQCYCSVYDECWLTSTDPKENPHGRPEPSDCEPPPQVQFEADGTSEERAPSP